MPYAVARCDVLLRSLYHLYIRTSNIHRLLTFCRGFRPPVPWIAENHNEKTDASIVSPWGGARFANVVPVTLLIAATLPQQR